MGQGCGKENDKKLYSLVLERACECVCMYAFVWWWGNVGGADLFLIIHTYQK